ncbi:MAG: processing protein [Clostridiales bacterium]|nr:processing protein [Clostridiales bacterium]MDK2932274.1 processing protein [Clostridiales bacterium]
MDKLKYWLWLTNLSGIGSIKITKALKVFESPEQIWNATKLDLKCADMLSEQDIYSYTNKSLDKAEKILSDLEKLGIEAITFKDPRYPQELKNIYDPPYVLYVKGNLPPCDAICISIVGSRKASLYGQNVAEKLSYQLAEKGITVVSGMARGIDTSAHKGALKAGKKTIAVLGCGVDIVYPKENTKLMEYIINNGAVISEFPPGTYPKPGNFPARNRIISGLAYGTVVVEAGERSGSLITADFALEQGRDVFAVPGNIDNYNSIGTNNLIKQGAKMVTCVEDVLEELPINNIELCNTNNGITKINDSVYLDLSNEEKIIISHLSTTPIHIDELCRKLGYSMQKINSILTLLEVKGLVAQIPGKYFALVNQL